MKSAHWTVMLLAILFVALGLVLFAGGVWLIVLGGSWYYALAGAGVYATGVLLARLRSQALWLYWAVFLLTAIWAFFEVGLDGWALVPRVFAPGVLLILLSLVAAFLMPARRALASAGAATAALLAIFLVAGLVGEENATLADGAWPAARPAPASLAMAGAPAVGDDWPAYGGGYGARRYSPLSQINRGNVDRLKRIWTFRTGDLPENEADHKYSPEITPVKIGEYLYLCTGMNVMISLHAATGRERWRHDPEVPEDAIPYGATCRGVAYYKAPDMAPRALCAERIIQGTLDARLIAVDASTGQPCPDFGADGVVNLRQGIGDYAPGFYSVTSPPTIVRGVAVVGAQVYDGQRRDAPSGVVRGYDAVTGELRWAWDLAEPGRTGAPPPGEHYTRGTPNMWTIASGDEQLGHVYLPMGNSAVDYWGADRRPESNLYSTALVALDVETGRPAWRFQTVHYDVWDYDLGSQATLVNLPAGDGAQIPALILPSKQGDIYILDRRSGTPIHPVIERPAPIGGVEPANLSRTQPASLYHTLRQPDLEEAQMWGMSPLDQLWCRIQFRRAAYAGIYTPPTVGGHWIQYPGYNGGSDWGGVALDPAHGVIIANYNDMPNHNRLLPREEADRMGLTPIDVPSAGATSNPDAGPQWGAPYAIEVNPGWRLGFTGLLCKQPPYGGIRAIELATGRTLWDRPFGTARKNGPFGIESGLPFRIGTPNNGGPIVTAGGLVFIAAATDDMVRAIDIRTGEEVWSDALPAGGQATPITYMANGRQFVLIAPGGHHFMETQVGDYVVAYALPDPDGPSETEKPLTPLPAAASR